MDASSASAYARAPRRLAQRVRFVRTEEPYIHGTLWGPTPLPQDGVMEILKCILLSRRCHFYKRGGGDGAK